MIATAEWRADYIRTVLPRGPVMPPLAWLQLYLTPFHTSSAQGAAPGITASFTTESMVLNTLIATEEAQSGVMSEETGRELVRRATSDVGCEALARSLVKKAAMSGQHLPGSMRNFVGEVVTGKPRAIPRGAPWWERHFRNIVGASALLVLTDRHHGFGLAATRNPASKTRDSACDLLAAATERYRALSVEHNIPLSITYNMATTMWKARERLWTEWQILMTCGSLRASNQPLTAEDAEELLAFLDGRTAP